MSNLTLRRGIYYWNKRNPLVLSIGWEQRPIIASLAKELHWGYQLIISLKKKIFNLISVRVKEYLGPSFLYEMTL